MLHRRGLVLSLLLLASSFASQVQAAPGKTPTSGMTLERIVVVMRHGIRPPTKDQPLPVIYTDQVWPKWDVPAGWLSGHGQQAIARVAEFDGKTYSGLLPKGCPTAGQVRVVADTDERTLKTASVYADTAFKGCHVTVENVGDGHVDPRFSPFETGAQLSDDAAIKAAQDALPAGGLAGLDQANHARLSLLSQVLACAKPPCDLSTTPTQLAVKTGRVKITGGLDVGSTLSQILLLEYADGKAPTDVGWGKVSEAQIGDLSALHALEFQLVARPKAIADFAASPLLKEVRTALTDDHAARYTLLVGHDGNLAYIGGALDLHWQAQGLAIDDPAPGGALIFELWRDAAGHKSVQVRYRSQSLAELRSLQPLEATDTAVLNVPGCAQKTSCSLVEFQALLKTVTAQ